MDLSIIILNYNTRGLLKYCLRHLFKHEPKLEYEIIIVDNASGDGSARMIKEEFLPHPRICLIENETNFGYAAGNNIGIKRAKGEHILLLNTDIFLFDNAIDQLVQYLQNNPKVGLVAPRMLNPDLSVQQTAHAFPSLLTPLFRRTFLGRTAWGKKNLTRYTLADKNLEDCSAIDWAISSAVMLRKATLEELNLLDEKFFLYFVDVDLCRRLWQKKLAVHYHPHIKMIHLHRRESADSMGFYSLSKKITRIHIRDWGTYLLKHNFR